ncbi:MAG: histidine kinase [Phaeodactylibacter sp.]|nr:histidine kinase [Phaeodactylibacter sp.]
METILHLIFWVLCFWILYSALAFESLEVLVENGIERSIYTRNPAAVPTLAIVLAARALLFYGLSFGVLSRFPEHRQWRPLLAQLALLVAASYLVEWGLLRALNKPPAVPPGIDILLYLFFTLAAFAYRLAKDWWRNERLRARLAEEKLTAELNYLKAQLNPHFLFNTLNNLYALAEREGNEPLSEGIAGLAELMRYAVYDSRADYVPLAKELHFLQRMVEMQSLRFDDEDELAVSFQVSGRYEQLKIAPLLLVPFVENAFKHGVRYGRQSFIRLEARVENRKLYFTASNTVYEDQARPHEDGGGIGLENARRRLKLLYPEQHQLEIKQQEDTFLVNLQLELDGR